MERYAGNFWQALKMDKETFLDMGRYPGLEPGKFSLTAFALRLSGQANGVSRLHGQVARKMWNILWPDKPEEKVPITYVTNGVHAPTWQAEEIQKLCQKYAGPDYIEGQNDADTWKALQDVPDGEFWQLHQLLKTRLIRLIQERAQQRWAEGTCSPQQVVEMGSLLDPYALTIAFSRRFAEYKRPFLITSDIGRLKKLVTDPLRPLQIIFAGKSHPADFASKNLINQVCLLTKDRAFQGRIIFVEDYDMHLSRDLVRGVDVWLNNPRRLQEACGTSGMKASMNGVINLSVRDGWWDEAFDEGNGWSIGGLQRDLIRGEDAGDAAALYELLEKEVIPLYYDRDRAGVPHRWIEMSKEAIRSVSPAFNAGRMVKEYTESMYLTAAGMAERLSHDNREHKR
jgi:starch phosphorylase